MHEKERKYIMNEQAFDMVWNEKAKSYLMDTIIRGLPIPPVFMRQKIDVTTKKTYREISNTIS